MALLPSSRNFSAPEILVNQQSLSVLSGILLVFSSDERRVSKLFDRLGA